MDDGQETANPIEVAPGVTRVSVGKPFASHVYLIDDPNGPIAFDAGVKGSGAEILAAAGGRLHRVILSRLAHLRPSVALTAHAGSLTSGDVVAQLEYAAER